MATPRNEPGNEPDHQPDHERGEQPTRPRPGAAAASRANLAKYAWLSIVAAIVTITLKVVAWRLTGSVGLASDAAESVVNLVAAVVALIALRIAAKPADDNHLYGHAKAEYFSAAVEGTMIFVAAVVIVVGAVDRFLHPQALEQLGVGVIVSVVASLVNGAVAFLLLRAARQHRSITLRADGKHLVADVYTSAGVLIGLGAVWLSGWERLDPLIAFAVGINIIVTGYKLVAESVSGLMDHAMSDEDHDRIVGILNPFLSDEVTMHALRTRESGFEHFVSFHVLVPGSWTVERGHDLVERIETALRAGFPDAQIATHLEPREDPRAYNDYVAEIPLSTSD